MVSNKVNTEEWRTQLKATLTLKEKQFFVIVTTDTKAFGVPVSQQSEGRALTHVETGETHPKPEGTRRTR